MERGLNTRCLHLEETEGKTENYGALSYPIYQTATYAHPQLGESTGYDYSRLQNPTRAQVEEVVAGLEGGAGAVAFSTGIAAVSAVMEIFNPGDHLIVADDLYGGSVRLFLNISKKNGVDISRVNFCEENVGDYITKNTKAIYFETPTNPIHLVFHGIRQHVA